MEESWRSEEEKKIPYEKLTLSEDFGRTLVGEIRDEWDLDCY